MTHVLVTAGCGFLGRHLVDELLSMGHRVWMEDQDLPDRPQDPSQGATLVPDLADPAQLRATLAQVEVVVHLICTGRPDPLAPLLLAAMAEAGPARLVLESSLEVYGEGLYADAAGHPVVPRRRAADLQAGRWEPRDDQGQPLRPLATPETTPPDPTSLAGGHALRREAEAMAWARGAPDRHLRILRLGTMFGPPHETANPLPGAIGRMMADVIAGRPPSLAEDGGQVRDWLHVRDAARALRLAVEYQPTGSTTFNIASGRGLRADEVARLIAIAAFRYDLTPQAMGLTAPGEARHLVGQPDLAARELGFTAAFPIENALGELAMWLREQAGPARPAAAQPDLWGSDLSGPGAPSA